MRWIPIDDESNIYDEYKCPDCHHYYTVDAERKCDIGFVIEDLRFCPNCGSPMFITDESEEQNAP